MQDYKVLFGGTYQLRESSEVDVWILNLHTDSSYEQKAYLFFTFGLKTWLQSYWIKTHIEERTGDDIIVFSIEERNPQKRVDETRVYIYNKGQKYIIVLEPQRKGQAYFLLTAYYLNKEYGEKQIKKKMKKGIIL